jgi:hypothetical protein
MEAANRRLHVSLYRCHKSTPSGNTQAECPHLATKSYHMSTDRLEWVGYPQWLTVDGSWRQLVADSGPQVI